MSINELTARIIGLAMKVHTALGPGLFEAAYEACLCHELANSGLVFERQTKVPIVYRGSSIEGAFCVDLIIEGRVLLELKSVARLEQIHRSQLLTYLRFTGHEVGLLINFNVLHLRHGIVRKINGPAFLNAQ